MTHISYLILHKMREKKQFSFKLINEAKYSILLLVGSDFALF